MRTSPSLTVPATSCSQSPSTEPGAQHDFASREARWTEGDPAPTRPMASPKTATLGSWAGRKPAASQTAASQPEPLKSGPAAKADARSVTPSPPREAFATAWAGQ